MLTHTTLQSSFDDSHLVVYQTPGCNTPTVACVCRTLEQAIIEADRLNLAQLERAEGSSLNAIVHDLGGLV